MMQHTRRKKKREYQNNRNREKKQQGALYLYKEIIIITAIAQDIFIWPVTCFLFLLSVRRCFVWPEFCPSYYVYVIIYCAWI